MSLEGSLTSPFVCLVMPAYNEAGRNGLEFGISRAIEQAHQGLSGKYDDDYEIFVADDGSTDNTVAIAEAAGATVLRLPHRGKGHAVRRGMQATGADFRAFVDADGSFHINDVIGLLDRVMRDADVAVAERRRGTDMASPDANKWRALASKTISWASHKIVPTGVKDTQCGAKAFRGPVADKLYGLATVDEFASDIEIIWTAEKLGYKVVSQACEVTPVDDSHVHWDDGITLLWDCVGIRLDSIDRQN